VNSCLFKLEIQRTIIIISVRSSINLNLCFVHVLNVYEGTGNDTSVFIIVLQRPRIQWLLKVG